MPSLIGQRIRELRIQSGLTQTQLAKGIVTPSMISQIEAGKAHPSSALLKKLAKRLEAPEEVLLVAPSEDDVILARIEVIRACVAVGRLDEAERLLNEAFNPPSGHLELYYLQGKVSMARGHLKEAASAFQQALPLTREQSKPEYLPEIYMLQGDIYMGLADVDTAIHLYDQSMLALREHAKMSGLLEAQISMRLSKAYAARGDHESAAQAAKQASERVTLGEPSKSMASQQVLQAVRTFGAGLEREAERLAVEACSLQDVYNWLEGSVRATLLEVRQLITNKLYEEASERLRTCLTQCQTYLSSELHAHILWLECTIAHEKADYETAAIKGKEALDLFPGSSEEIVAGAMLASQAALCAGRIENGLMLAQSALERSLQLSNMFLPAEAGRLLASAYKQSGRTADAEAVFGDLEQRYDVKLACKTD